MQRLTALLLLLSIPAVLSTGTCISDSKVLESRFKELRATQKNVALANIVHDPVLEQLSKAQQCIADNDILPITPRPVPFVGGCSNLPPKEVLALTMIDPASFFNTRNPLAQNFNVSNCNHTGTYGDSKHCCKTGKQNCQDMFLITHQEVRRFGCSCKKCKGKFVLACIFMGFNGGGNKQQIPKIPFNAQTSLSTVTCQTRTPTPVPTPVPVPSQPSKPRCENGKKEKGEVCDGNDVGGKQCKDVGFASGTLGCRAGCQLFDTRNCAAGPPPATCGTQSPAVVDKAQGEECDGANLDGQSCATLREPAGQLACSPSCKFDRSGCTGSDKCKTVQCNAGVGGCVFQKCLPLTGKCSVLIKKPDNTKCGPSGVNKCLAGICVAATTPPSFAPRFTAPPTPPSTPSQPSPPSPPSTVSPTTPTPPTPPSPPTSGNPPPPVAPANVPVVRAPAFKGPFAPNVGAIPGAPSAQCGGATCLATECAWEVCSPQMNQCTGQVSYRPNGTPCGGGGSKCQGGHCLPDGQQPPACAGGCADDAARPCEEAVCNPVTLQCDRVPKATGANCGAAGGGPGTCAAGTCVPLTSCTQAAQCGTTPPAGGAGCVNPQGAATCASGTCALPYLPNFTPCGAGGTMCYAGQCVPSSRAQMSSLVDLNLLNLPDEILPPPKNSPAAASPATGGKTADDDSPYWLLAVGGGVGLLGMAGAAFAAFKMCKPGMGGSGRRRNDEDSEEYGAPQEEFVENAPYVGEDSGFQGSGYGDDGYTNQGYDDFGTAKEFTEEQSY